MAGIGTVMFLKAIALPAGGAALDWYRGFKARKRRGATVFLHPDKRGVYVPADDGFAIFERWLVRLKWTWFGWMAFVGVAILYGPVTERLAQAG